MHNARQQEGTRAAFVRAGRRCCRHKPQSQGFILPDVDTGVKLAGHATDTVTTSGQMTKVCLATYVVHRKDQVTAVFAYCDTMKRTDDTLPQPEYRVSSSAQSVLADQHQPRQGKHVTCCPSSSLSQLCHPPSLLLIDTSLSM